VPHRARVPQSSTHAAASQRWSGPQHKPPQRSASAQQNAPPQLVPAAQQTPWHGTRESVHIIGPSVGAPSERPSPVFIPSVRPSRGPPSVPVVEALQATETRSTLASAQLETCIMVRRYQGSERRGGGLSSRPTPVHVPDRSKSPARCELASLRMEMYPVAPPPCRSTLAFFRRSPHVFARCMHPSEVCPVGPVSIDRSSQKVTR
jgi:hypothetical protein